MPGASRLGPFVDLVKEEVNVKSVSLTDEVGDAGEMVLQLNMSVLGPRLGPDTQKVLGAVRSGHWERTSDGAVSVSGRVLAEDEYSLRLTPSDESTSRALPGNAGLVLVDTATTPELESEGLARDVVRLVQSARKDAGLHVADRIHLVVDPHHHHDVKDALTTHRDYVMGETLARELIVNGPLANGHRGELPDGRAILIGLSRLD
jgi:isoleucyl-tRNA synthetase